MIIIRQSYKTDTLTQSPKSHAVYNYSLKLSSWCVGLEQGIKFGKRFTLSFGDAEKAYPTQEDTESKKQKSRLWPKVCVVLVDQVRDGNRPDHVEQRARQGGNRCRLRTQA